VLSAGAALVDSTGRVVETEELVARVAAQARELEAAGARPGRVVTVALKDPAAMLIAALAVWETGAALSPRPGPPGVAVDREVPVETGLLLFTSGSSGSPKGVLLSRAGVVANVDAILEYLPIAAHPRTAIVLPLHYSYALVGQAFATLRAGGTAILLGDVPYPARQIALMHAYEARGLSSVATSLRLLARAARELGAPELGYVASAGGPLDHATRDLLREVWPAAQLWNQYGLTEASPRVTAVSSDEPAFWQGSVGRPIRGVSVESVDWRAAGPRTVDDARLSSTASPLAGPLHTGDLGRVDAEGYVWVEGRRDGLVKVAGERVSVDEVAAALRAAVRDACVVAIPDELTGVRLVAFVEGDAAAARRAAQSLPPAKRPSRIVEVDALPRLPSGKPAVEELRRRALDVLRSR
jgi:acyl-coenzyme A synthetase/AMP-(fatty) acid ligase